MVKMQSLGRCSKKEYSGKGHACDGDVFVAMLNPVGTLMWATSLNTRNIFMQRSNIEEVDHAAVSAWSNRAYWAYFDKQTLRLGVKEPDVRTVFWPLGGLYTKNDSSRFWWAGNSPSEPVVPGSEISPEWGNICDNNRCETRVPPPQNPGGSESIEAPMYRESAQRRI